VEQQVDRDLAQQQIHHIYVVVEQQVDRDLAQQQIQHIHPILGTELLPRVPPSQKADLV
jgi:hypothetical protein